MITLWNPTTEEFKGMYGGETFIIGPKQKVKVEDAVGRHVLNQLTPRGLCKLDYGDDEAAIGKDGIDRWIKFRTKMVMDHNHMNLVRSQTGREYLPPSKEVKQYADDLKLILDGPFSLKVNEDTSSLQSIKLENMELKNQLTMMMSKMQDMMDRSDREREAKKEPEPVPEPIEVIEPTIGPEVEAIAENTIEDKPTKDDGTPAWKKREQERLERLKQRRGYS